MLCTHPGSISAGVGHVLYTEGVCELAVPGSVPSGCAFLGGGWPPLTASVSSGVGNDARRRVSLTW